MAFITLLHTASTTYFSLMLLTTPILIPEISPPYFSTSFLGSRTCSSQINPHVRDSDLYFEKCRLQSTHLGYWLKFEFKCYTFHYNKKISTHLPFPAYLGFTELIAVLNTWVPLLFFAMWCQALVLRNLICDSSLPILLHFFIYIFCFF